MRYEPRRSPWPRIGTDCCGITDQLKIGFVYCVDRALVATVTTPRLVLAGNDEAHPLPISEDLARLLADSERIREWKTDDRSRRRGCA